MAQWQMHSLGALSPELIDGAGSFADSPVHPGRAGLRVTEQHGNAAHPSTCAKGETAQSPIR